MSPTLRRLSVVAAGVLATAGLGALPASASTPPERPTGVHEVSATSTSMTVAAKQGQHTTRYIAYVSTDKSALWVSHINSSTKRASSRTAQVTIEGLTYTAAPVYYRLEAFNGHRIRWGTIYTGGLAPAAPSSVSISTVDGVPYLTWSGDAASGYAVTQSTDPQMDQNRVTTMVEGHYDQFTPNVTPGNTYYFQVRARNGSTMSAPSPVVSAAATSHQQIVRTMTYNIMEATTAGQRTSGEARAPWSKRRAGVVKLIEQSHADVVAIQEAISWIGKPGYGGTRQIDDLVRHLPGYKIARTETPPTEHHYHRYGDYILYRTAAYKPVGKGGVWSLGGDRFAAHHVMENRTTGARFMFVSVHTVAGHGRNLDGVRRSQTENLVEQAGAAAQNADVPVVFGGDFNSAIGAYDQDAPGLVMRASHMTDARAVATKRYHASYNSANQYDRVPPLHHHCIDFIYTGPGVGVHSWGVIADLHHHRFVGVIPSDHDPVWADVSISY